MLNTITYNASRIWQLAHERQKTLPNLSEKWVISFILYLRQKKNTRKYRLNWMNFELLYRNVWYQTEWQCRYTFTTAPAPATHTFKFSGEYVIQSVFIYITTWYYLRNTSFSKWSVWETLINREDIISWPRHWMDTI